MDSVYNFTLPDIEGEEMSLGRYSGKVLMLVNVASRCGFTPQYAGLQRLYERYRERGLEILGFPANDFLRQEPGTNEQIKAFCTLNYGVSFPMFSKISVKGRKIHPLYKYLTERASNPEFGGAITWNFTKFLVDRTGHVAGRFSPREDPESERLASAVERLL
jgi:glutathione peroxidase